MKYIQITKSLYYKDKFVGDDIYFSIVKDIPEDKTEELNWNNLNKIPFTMRGYGGYRETRRGRKVILDYSSMFYVTTIKQWKNENPHLKLITTHRELNPSINTILDFHDGAKAAKYLKENFGLERIIDK